MGEYPEAMELRHHDDRFADRVLYPMLRGCLAGAIAVAAIAVWAVNFEAFINAKGQGNLFFAMIRLAVCDAIPLAIVFITFRWLSHSGNSEGLLSTIVGSVFVLGAAKCTSASDDERGFQVDG